MNLKKQAATYARVCNHIANTYPFHVRIPTIKERHRPDKYKPTSGNYFGRIPRTPGVALTATWCFATQADADEFKKEQGL